MPSYLHNKLLWSWYQMAVRHRGGIETNYSPLPFLSSPVVLMRNIMKHRNLLGVFVFKDLRKKYRGSIAGYGWTMIEPLVMTAVFYVLFGIITSGKDEFRPLHIIIGILTWYYFQRTVVGFTNMFQSRKSLIQVVYFPREVFLCSILLFNAIVLVLSLIVVLPLVYYYGLIPNWRIIFLPYCILMVGLLSSGIGLFSSILQTRVKDTEHVVNLAMRVGFYLSPCFYTLETMSRVPEPYINSYLFANPMAVYLTMIRSAFTGSPTGISDSHIISSFGVTLVVFFLGTIFFLRNERQAVKYI